MSDGGAIGARVRAARERLGWSREALAFHAGISWSAIAQVESGRRTHIRPSTLVALSRPLGVSIDYLVDGRRPPPTMLNHSVFPYGGADQFRAAMGSFLAEGVERSEAVLVVTTRPNITLLHEHLGVAAQGVEFVDSSLFLTTPTAALSAFKAFTEVNLERGAPWLRILAEPRWEDRSDAEVRLWTRFESLLNLVFASCPMTLVCPYDERSVAPEVLTHALATHPHAMGEGGMSDSADYAGPGQFAFETG